MQIRFLNRFKRITYSTNYLPEIDGLRFLAILSVVVIMHIPHYLDEKFYSSKLIQGKYWQDFVIEGGHGVALFFIISGFILSLPFARWRLNNEKKISLKKYFLRRLTRLEPPYLIALTIFFVAHVWVLRSFSFNELLPHFVASAAYQHVAFYHSFSPVMPVAWSLEVEVQFYVLAPLFFLIFLIRSAITRWILCSMIILSGAIYWYGVEHQVHVFRYIFLFFSGILLADLYCCRTAIFKNTTIGLLAGICSLIGYLFIPSIHNFPGYLVKIACMFVLVHTVLTNPHMKRIFSAKLIMLIGGMCYSIYLLHLAIISFAGRVVLGSGIRTSDKSLAPAFGLVFIIAVLFISAIYFLLVEKPFMRPIGLRSRVENK